MSGDRIDFHEIHENVHGSFMGYYAKGHIDPVLFCSVINTSTGSHAGDVRHLVPEMVRHVYVRKTRAPDGEGDMQMVECRGPKQGATAVTMADPTQTNDTTSTRFALHHRLQGEKASFSWMISYDSGQTWAKYGVGSLPVKTFETFRTHALDWCDQVVDIDAFRDQAAMPYERH